MKRKAGRQQDLAPGSFTAAEMFQLRMALKSTYAERLQDLQDMINFNADAEALNPQLRWLADQLRKAERG
jgi:hypothetical protein